MEQEEKLLLQFAEEGKALDEVKVELTEIMKKFEKELNEILDKLPKENSIINEKG